ncbi:uncharacterized protein LTR77_006138 [Saxophila tyrrhenica]|uniref:Protein kinase domain-containing protein n=1 Tax=Saxophila tyrrhenica TaxID=1690608 RepID=A0AAV9PA33_9PEZI|nr:hypothetical protein LTR77_006138 [Saxophila tyrrhenica]
MSSKESQALEGQSLFNYRQKQHYPLNIGDILHDRYRVLAKLGFGAYSTVWLSRDERTSKHLCLKVCVNDETTNSPVLNEAEMLRHLESTSEAGDHPGLDFIRLADDIFEADGPTGRHHCIAMKPQGVSVRTLQEFYPDERLPKLLVRSLVHRLLFAIDWLHSRCQTIHTDITPLNVLTQAEDDAVFQQIERQELQDRSGPTTEGESVAYPSRRASQTLSGIPILTDFGQMRYADPINDSWSMPDTYRAPEVLLGLPWDYPVDLWSLGMMAEAHNQKQTLELLEGKNVFDPIDRTHNKYDIPLALSQYISLLGHPPTSMIERSQMCFSHFDEEGAWYTCMPSHLTRTRLTEKHTGHWIWTKEYPIPEESLTDFVTAIPPCMEKDLFLKFVRSMLTWDPDIRLTANELAEDEWLMMLVEQMAG